MTAESDPVLRCDVAIIGGGAAGYFTAANLSLPGKGLRCSLFEGSSRPLAKVRISGGGRCNVTHRPLDVAKLVEFYPRGFRELRGPFSRFQPEHMIAWLRQRGVATKVEADGRVFPVSDDSGQIVQTLIDTAAEVGVQSYPGHRLASVQLRQSMPGFVLHFQNGRSFECRYLVLSTGSHASGHRIAEDLGHEVVAPVPSLFTFNITDPRLEGLAGVAFPEVRVSLTSGKRRFEQMGPLLITHWGLSGPAILKLSAWAARELASLNYRGALEIDFAPHRSFAEIEELLTELRVDHGSKDLRNAPMPGLPKRYWRQLLEILGMGDLKVAQLHKGAIRALSGQLKSARFEFDGKSTHKDEFVTAGGIATRELDMKCMQSRKIPGLYVVGEAVNVDGVTGGFNFQFAWTSAFLCASDLNARIRSDAGL